MSTANQVLALIREIHADGRPVRKAELIRRLGYVKHARPNDDLVKALRQLHDRGEIRLGPPPMRKVEVVARGGA